MVLDDSFFKPRPSEDDCDRLTKLRSNSNSPNAFSKASGISLGTIDRSLATPMDRLAAAVADFLLVYPFIAVLVAPFGRRAREASLLGADSSWLLQILSVTAVGLFALIILQALFVAVFGATPGKMALRLRVVSVWDGERPRALEAFTRAVVWSLELLFLGIPFMAVFSNLRRRPFHDRAADTVVITLNRARRSGLADLPEMAMASGFQTAVLSAVTFVAVVSFVDFQRSYDANFETAMKHEDEGKLCPEVRETIAEYPNLRAGEVKDRLETALLLFNGDGLSSQCLDSEAEFALWRGHDKPLAYLAKGLAMIERDEEVSRTYLGKACESARGDRKTSPDVCRLATLARANLAPPLERDVEVDAGEEKIMQVREEAELTAIVGSVGPQTKPYLRMAVARKLLSEGENGRALTVMNDLHESRQLGVFVAQARAKALWRSGRKNEAVAAMRAFTDLSDFTGRVEISRWFCTQETDFKNCGERARGACSALSSAVAQDEKILLKSEIALGYVRAQSCLESDVDWSELAKRFRKVENQDGAAFLEARVEGLEALKEFWRRASDKSAPFAVEAALDLIGRVSSREGLAEFEKSWSTMASDGSATQLVGRHLMSRLKDFKAWDDAMAIGLKILKDAPEDRETYAMMVAVAQGAGKSRMAGDFLSRIPGRKPASVEADTSMKTKDGP